MAISSKNLELALKAAGLDQPGPIRADVLNEKRAHAARYAEFLGRMDHLDSLDLTDLPPIPGKIPTI